MSRFLTFNIAFLFITIMFSCKSYNDRKMQDLITAKAGTIISEDVVHTFGIDFFFSSSEITEELFLRINNKSYKKNSTIKITRKEYSTGKYDSYCMNGVGGSLVTVIPEIDTVICMTCSLVYNPKPRMELINNYLIPYIEKL